MIDHESRQFLSDNQAGIVPIGAASLILVLLSFFMAGCGLQKSVAGMPDMVFIGWDEQHNEQLFRLNRGGELNQLTELANGVYDFATAPNGRFIAFTTTDGEGSTGIWQMDSSGDQQEEILACPAVSCRQPVWSPTRNRIIYERRNIRADGTEGAPFLWWLDLESGESWPALEDSEAHGSAARFSPDGNWLSFVSLEDDGVYIYNLDDGRSQFFTNEVGMPVSWSPDSDRVIVPNLDLVIVHGDQGDNHLEHTHDYQSATHLFVGDADTGELQLISGEQSVEDSVAAWSPDGSWIAFGRRPPHTSAGRQLWLMHPNGSEAHPLTDDPDANYGPPSWSPDGRYLLYQRYGLKDSQNDPEIWMYDLESDQHSKLIPSGMLPQWLAATS